MLKQAVQRSTLYERAMLPVRQLLDWRRRGYADTAPQFVKERVLERYGVRGAPWVETGTFMGTTTAFLASRYPQVYTIEPAPALFAQARERFKGMNVELINDVSEVALPALLPRLKGDLNFWLDGHFSAGVTFKGDKECPVEEELNAIEKHLGQFRSVAILIDDVRCFVPYYNREGRFPSIDFILEWARRNGFLWQIEHNIFVMTNR